MLQQYTRFFSVGVRLPVSLLLKQACKTTQLLQAQQLAQQLAQAVIWCHAVAGIARQQHVELLCTALVLQLGAVTFFNCKYLQLTNSWLRLCLTSLRFLLYISLCGEVHLIIVFRHTRSKKSELSHRPTLAHGRAWSCGPLHSCMTHVCVVSVYMLLQHVP